MRVPTVQIGKMATTMAKQMEGESTMEDGVQETETVMADGETTTGGEEDKEGDVGEDVGTTDGDIINPSSVRYRKCSVMLRIR